jgi:hypothetical protein
LTNHEKILQVANLMIELNELERQDASPKEVASASENFDRALASFDDPRDLLLVSFAEKMMSGRKFFFQTDNPKSLIRLLEIARMLGAHVHSLDEVDGIMRVLFIPANRH